MVLRYWDLNLDRLSISNWSVLFYYFLEKMGIMPLHHLILFLWLPTNAWVLISGFEVLRQTGPRSCPYETPRTSVTNCSVIKSDILESSQSEFKYWLCRLQWRRARPWEKSIQLTQRALLIQRLGLADINFSNPHFLHGMNAPSQSTIRKIKLDDIYKALRTRLSINSYYNGLFTWEKIGEIHFASGKPL